MVAYFRTQKEYIHTKCVRKKDRNSSRRKKKKKYVTLRNESLVLIYIKNNVPPTYGQHFFLFLLSWQVMMGLLSPFCAVNGHFFLEAFPFM